MPEPKIAIKGGKASFIVPNSKERVWVDQSEVWDYYKSGYTPVTSQNWIDEPTGWTKAADMAKAAANSLLLGLPEGGIRIAAELGNTSAMQELKEVEARGTLEATKPITDVASLFVPFGGVGKLAGLGGKAAAKGVTKLAEREAAQLGAKFIGREAAVEGLGLARGAAVKAEGDLAQVAFSQAKQEIESLAKLRDMVATNPQAREAYIKAAKAYGKDITEFAQNPEVFKAIADGKKIPNALLPEIKAIAAAKEGDLIRRAQQASGEDVGKLLSEVNEMKGNYSALHKNVIRQGQNFNNMAKEASKALAAKKKGMAAQQLKLSKGQKGLDTAAAAGAKLPEEISEAIEKASASLVRITADNPVPFDKAIKLALKDKKDGKFVEKLYKFANEDEVNQLLKLKLEGNANEYSRYMASELEKKFASTAAQQAKSAGLQAEANLAQSSKMAMELEALTDPNIARLQKSAEGMRAQATSLGKRIQALDNQEEILNLSAKLQKAHEETRASMAGFDSANRAQRLARIERDLVAKWDPLIRNAERLGYGAAEGAAIGFRDAMSEGDIKGLARSVILGATIGSMWAAGGAAVSLAGTKAKRAMLRKTGADIDMLEYVALQSKKANKQLELAKTQGNPVLLLDAQNAAERANAAWKKYRVEAFREAAQNGNLASKIISKGIDAGTHRISNIMGHLAFPAAYGAFGGIDPTGLTASILVAGFSRKIGRSARESIWNSVGGIKEPGIFSKGVAAISKIAKYGAYKILSHQELDKAKDTTPDPQELYEDAKTGYVMGGADPEMAEAAAQFEYARAKIQQQYLNRDNKTAADRAEASLAYHITTEPNAITAMIMKDQLSEKGWKMWAEMFPQQANQLGSMGVFLLKEHRDKLPASKVRTLQTITGERKLISQWMMQNVWNAPESPAPSPTKPDNRLHTGMESAILNK